MTGISSNAWTLAEKEASAEPTETNPPTEDMDLETLHSPAQNPDDGGYAYGVNNGDSNSNSNSKRGRDEDSEESDEASKKQKVEKSVEEERLEKNPGSSESGRVRLGPKELGSSVEMFDYFYNLLHYWPSRFNLNKVLHAFATEGAHCIKVRDILNASDVWSAYKDQKHDLFLPSNAQSAAVGVAGLIENSSSRLTYALTAPPQTAAQTARIPASSGGDRISDEWGPSYYLII